VQLLCTSHFLRPARSGGTLQQGSGAAITAAGRPGRARTQLKSVVEGKLVAPRIFKALYPCGRPHFKSWSPLYCGCAHLGGRGGGGEGTAPVGAAVGMAVGVCRRPRLPPAAQDRHHHISAPHGVHDRQASSGVTVEKDEMSGFDGKKAETKSQPGTGTPDPSHRGVRQVFVTAGRCQSTGPAGCSPSLRPRTAAVQLTRQQYMLLIEIGSLRDGQCGGHRTP